MKILRITVKPTSNGQTTVRVQGQDDSGHILDSWATTRPGQAVEDLLQAQVRSLQTTASEFTENETFDENLKAHGRM